MKPYVRVDDRHGFDTLIDVRSPAEFAIDHIPGALNCPVLDDEERRIVGTLYKQSGAFEARRVGGAMVAANLARHLRERLADQPASWRPMVYCWRGGLRSASMVTWLRMVGWDAQQLAGGYKSWRRHVIDLLETQAPRLPLVVICGATGSGKTRVLQALAASGEQVLDIEALARHKGSLLGALPGIAQPSQTGFETALADAIERVDLGRPLYVEGEGARIGQLNLPVPLVTRMRDSPCVEIDVPMPARLTYLLHDYAYLGDRPDWLVEQLGRLRALHGGATIETWQAMARTGDLPHLFAALAARHYDPAYARSQRRHFHRWATRTVIAADSLTPEGIAALAQRIAGHCHGWVPA
ncbi:tRNA 2-selenouridine(34) synthase MnmH [Cupriavidus pauculus]|uniref:tRNA 2-selenouridine(34) synthase MnmH n=1 Tax=Cupriavidus pauculus TaxID=82633 RepID=A0A3G8H6Y2_9BURK|nr:tRNA 2-selenouridine(34) synthase MnmH [Cupriavidus pauculus]AZG16307.1 tRNA 2-selenouridine(34) synthase MnmH [Cupriavidus pauculus]